MQRFTLSILTLVMAFGLTAAAGAQPPRGDELEIPDLDSFTAPDGTRVVRISPIDRRTTLRLTQEIDVWSVHPEEDFLVAQVDDAELAKLRAEGFDVAIDAERTITLSRLGIALDNQFVGIPGYPCYRTVEETFTSAQTIVAEHPDLATWIDIGDSWEKTQNPSAGYDLFVLELTQSAVPGPKPVFFANFTIHAREYTTAELGTRFAEYLVDGYGVDPDVTWLLDHHEIHLLLVTNPDGRKQAETGLSWRKNTDNDYCSNTNSRGADLNRNFEFQWGCCGGSSSSQCSATYRGPLAASEPEIQALQAYVSSIFPDQRAPDLSAPAPDDATGVAIDVHSYGELVLWSWGFDPDPAPNGTQLTTLGRKLAYFNGHTPQQGTELYVTDGSSKDFYYGELGIAGLVFELGTQFFESCSVFESQILESNIESLFYAAKVARTPYLTPAGPDAYDAAVPPVPVAAGDLVTLTATVDDTRYNGSNGTEPTQTIAAAEAFVDLPPWDVSATPLSMNASDGTFDQNVEGVEVTIDTTGLASGRHLLFVQGVDSALNEGAVSAAFLWVVDPASAPTIQGTVRDSVTLTPLEATVTIGGFVTTSDPGTGFYSLQVPPGTYDLSVEATGYLPASVSGLQAAEFQTVVQDFNLFPEAACDADVDFDDGGAAGWFNTAQSTCSTGAFVVATPTLVTNGGVVTQVGGDHTSGTGNAYFSATNSSAGSNDVDSGVCIVESPVYPVALASDLSIWYFHGQRDAGDDAGDFFLLELSTNGGSDWSSLASFGDVRVDAEWTEVTASIPAGSDVKLRLQVADGSGPGDLVEAGIDDLLICPSAPACTTDPECDDGLYCNGVETCNAGTCQPGTPIACDDGVSCTVDTCDEATDSCTSSADDGLCSNGLFCDGSETCDPVLGCQAGTPVDCDDGIGCTVDTCDEAGDACSNLPDDLVCSNGVFCDGAEICNPAVGCESGGDPCPGLFCDEPGATCFECNVDGDCDDGLFCNGVETCDGGSCLAGSDPCLGQSCDEVGDVCVSGPQAQLEWGTVSVGATPVTVTLAQTYVSPVVIASIGYDANTTPVVTRISNVTAASFDARLQSPSGGAVATEEISYLVVEEGVWTIDGFAIEAWTYTSTVTDENGTWTGEAQSYGQSYTNPVVLGQVMSENDADWSVFWNQGSSRTNPPSAAALRTGKTVCEDPDTTRVDETVGVVVIEAGHGTLGGVEIEAALGADTVRGVTNSPPYTYSFQTAFATAPSVALVTMAGVDGGNGGWAYTYGSAPTTASTLALVIDEDQVGDSERSHTSEQVGYVVFAGPGSASP